MGRSYKDLAVWQKSMELVTSISRYFNLPKYELLGSLRNFAAQRFLFRSNIAEGQDRLSEKQIRHFLGQVRGSLMEVETQLLIAENLAYLQKESANKLLDGCAEVGRILNRLLASVSKQAGA